jgi:hypothetical protein
VWDKLYPYFLWIENTSPAHYIRESKWIFSVAEVFHLFGLTLLLGIVTILSLRLCGLVLKTKELPAITRELRPLSIGALTLVLSTGVILFISEATKCWGNTGFRFKVLFLFLALLFQFTGLQTVTRASEYRFSPMTRKITAFVAVFLWFGVAVAGRAIAFF